MGVARGAAREVAASGGVGARQRAPRNAVAVHILVAGEFLAGIELGGAHDLAAVIFTRIGPLERFAQMLVHADVQVAHDKHRGLQTFGQIQRGGGMLEAFGGVVREQQDVFGVAVRGVSAGQQVGLLGARGHACGRPATLYVDEHGGDLGKMSQADEFGHQGNAGAGGGGECAGTVPARAQDDADGGQFVFGLDNRAALAAGLGVGAVFRAIFHEGLGRRG